MQVMEPALVPTFVLIPRRSMDALVRVAAAFDAPLKEAVERIITAAHEVNLAPIPLPPTEPCRPIVCAFPADLAPMAHEVGGGLLAAVVGILPPPPGTPIYYANKPTTTRAARDRTIKRTPRPLIAPMHTVTFSAARKLGLDPPTTEEMREKLDRWKKATGFGERILAERLSMSRAGMLRHFCDKVVGVGPRFQILEQINKDLGVSDDERTYAHYLAKTDAYRSSREVRRATDAMP